MGKFVDLTGQKFGRLTVLERAEDYISPKGQKCRNWKCECDCGNIVIVRGANLKSGNSKSCGCVEHIQPYFDDLAGKRFGRLTVIERVDNYVFPSGQTRTKWKCKCDCGNITYVLGSGLKSGTTKSCGCLQREQLYKANKKYNKYDLTGEYGIGYTSNSNKDGINYFYFDIEDYDKIKNYCWYMRQDGYVLAHSPVQKQRLRLHRLIMTPIPNNKEVDHINHIKYDNRKCNLRIVTSQQNKMNGRIKAHSNTGIIGVSYDNKGEKYRAYIGINNECKSLGFFDNIEDAIKARKEAEKKYFGEYAYDENANKIAQ